MHQAELVVEHQGMRLDRDISPSALQPSPRSCLRGGKVFSLDDTLNVTIHRSLALSATARLLNAAKDLSIVVGADQSDLVVAAVGVSRLPLPEAEVACIFPGGDVVVTAPVIENATYEGTDYAFRAGQRVLLINADTGRVLDEVVLDIPDAYMSAVQHPVAPVAVLTAGEGQDGSRVFTVAETDGRLSVEMLAENVIAASFNRSGTRLLVTPHPTFGPSLQVLNWPDGAQFSTATTADTPLADDSFDVCGCYLDDDRVLAMTTAGRLIALEDRLIVLGEVSLLPYEHRPGLMVGISSANFAVQTWHDGAASTSVWRLPPSQS